MTASWQESTLGEVCDLVGGTIRTGPFGSQLHQQDYSDEGIPVVMPQDIVDGRISTANIARVAEAHAARLVRHRLRTGDIVYGRRGDIGRRALIRKDESGWLCGTGCLRISLGERAIEPEFLFHYLGNPDVASWVANQAIGATMPNLNTSIIRSVAVRYPDLQAQRKIASVLSAYDALIENNLRRIKILEEMARSLYKEWFVDFRFPGHENATMLDSPLGLIPEGWETVPVGDVLDGHIGGGWGSDEPTEKESRGAYVVRGTDMPEVGRFAVGGVPHRFHGRSNLESRRLAAGDVVMEVSGGGKNVGVGRSLLVSERLLQRFDDCVMCASFCKRMWVRQDRIAPVIFWMHLVRRHADGGLEEYEVQSTGIKNFKFAVFLQQELLALAPVRLQREFAGVVQEVVDLIGSLGVANAVLRRTRDLLLPRLVSGELDVSELDIDVGKDAA